MLKSIPEHVKIQYARDNWLQPNMLQLLQLHKGFLAEMLFFRLQKLPRVAKTFTGAGIIEFDGFFKKANGLKKVNRAKSYTFKCFNRLSKGKRYRALTGKIVYFIRITFFIV